jgi:hypothetical protein
MKEGHESESSDAGRLEGDIERVEEQMMAMAHEARRAVEEFVIEKPHAALAIAAASGFVLGGGLTPRRILRLGFAVAGPLLSRVLVQQATDYLQTSFDTRE